MKNRFFYIFLALGVGLMALSSCERIDAGHVGLKVNYYGSDKGVSDVTEVTGWQFYWPLSSTIVEFPTFTQTKDYEAFAVTAKDASTFTVDPIISYYVKADRAAHVYRQYRKPLKELENSVLKNLVYDSYRITVNRFTSDSLMANRLKFEEQLQALLQSQMEGEGFILQQLTSNIEPPASLKAAIDAKNTAVQASFATKNLVEKEKAQAEINIAKARGDAESIRIRAQAEAEANRIVSQSLSPGLIEYKKLERWDGKYPSTLVGGAGSSSILINPK